MKNLDPSKIKKGKKSYKSIRIYYIGYMTMNSVKLLHCIIINVNGYTEESNGNKYLTLVPTDESKDTLKKYKELCSKIRDLIRSIIIRSIINRRLITQIVMVRNMKKDDYLTLKKKNAIAFQHDNSCLVCFHEGNKYYPQGLYKLAE